MKVEAGWGVVSHRLSVAGQAPYRGRSFISGYLRSTYMPGGVLGARDTRVSKNGSPALLELSSYLSRTNDRDTSSLL